MSTCVNIQKYTFLCIYEVFAHMQMFKRSQKHKTHHRLSKCSIYKNICQCINKLFWMHDLKFEIFKHLWDSSFTFVAEAELQDENLSLFTLGSLPWDATSKFCVTMEMFLYYMYYCLVAKKTSKIIYTAKVELTPQSPSDTSRFGFSSSAAKTCPRWSISTEVRGVQLLQWCMFYFAVFCQCPTQCFLE